MLVYWVVVTGVHAIAYYQGFRERELRVLDLEKRLTTARLEALQMQLNPHFLFNALNGISTLMYRDVDAADSMLVRLSELLRHALDRSDRQQVTLRDEVAFLDRYLALEKMRFGDRLAIEKLLDPETLDDLVPNLVLQPLVENCLKHGLSTTIGPGRVTLKSSHPSPVELRLEVEDNGRGLPPEDQRSEGIGLSNGRARLRQLYGRHASIELHPVSGGGTRAVVTLPRAEVGQKREPRAGSVSSQ